MAQSRRFYFWEGYWRSLAKFPDDASRGAFLMAMCEKAFLDVDPDFGDDIVSQVTWEVVCDQITESVAIGERSSRSGKAGGRPSAESKKSADKPKVTTRKRGVKSTVKMGAKNSVKSTVKNTPFNEEKGKEGTGRDQNLPFPLSGERGAGEGSLGATLPAPVQGVSYDMPGTAYQARDPMYQVQDPLYQGTMYQEPRKGEAFTDSSLIDPSKPMPLIPPPIMPTEQVDITDDGQGDENGPA